MAGNLGFSCCVVADATDTFDRVGHDGKRLDAKDFHRIRLASLDGEFATDAMTGDLLRLS